MGKKPQISVIIPVYNAEKYLHECVDTVVNQSLKDIEIICVNDGSTDSSLAILEEYAKKDNRIILLSQKNRGAGAARNAGLKIAKGKYLSFLDSDDFFSLAMLEKAYSIAEERKVEIVVYNTKTFNIVTGQYKDGPHLLNNYFIPSKIIFSYHDVPIIDALGPCLWNKLFLKDLIDRNKIVFQETKRANDLFFTFVSVICARNITVINDPLLYYRIGNDDNLQSTNHKTPFEFNKALIALKKKLIEINKYKDVEKWFISFIIRSCLYNLSSLRKPNAYELVYNKVKNEILPSLNIPNEPQEYFYTTDVYNEIKNMQSMSVIEYLFFKKNFLITERDWLQGDRDRIQGEKDRLQSEKDWLQGDRDRIQGEKDQLQDERDRIQRENEQLQSERDQLQDKLDHLQKNYDALLFSISYRIGRIITWLPRKIRGILKYLKKK